MIIWSELLYMQKDQELKALDRFRNDLNLFDTGFTERNLFRHLMQHTHKTHMITSEKAHSAIVDASISTNKDKPNITMLDKAS